MIIGAGGDFTYAKVGVTHHAPDATTGWTNYLRVDKFILH
jgi:hypothetical protein